MKQQKQVCKGAPPGKSVKWLLTTEKGIFEGWGNTAFVAAADANVTFSEILQAEATDEPENAPPKESDAAMWRRLFSELRYEVIEIEHAVSLEKRVNKTKLLDRLGGLLVDSYCAEMECAGRG